MSMFRFEPTEEEKDAALAEETRPICTSITVNSLRDRKRREEITRIAKDAKDPDTRALAELIAHTQFGVPLEVLARNRVIHPNAS